MSGVEQERERERVEVGRCWGNEGKEERERQSASKGV